MVVREPIQGYQQRKPTLVDAINLSWSMKFMILIQAVNDISLLFFSFHSCVLQSTCREVTQASDAGTSY